MPQTRAISVELSARPHRQETAETARMLARCYRDRAGEEALFRALLADRDLNRAKARFWIDVWELLPGKNRVSEAAPPGRVGEPRA